MMSLILIGETYQEFALGKMYLFNRASFRFQSENCCHSLTLLDCTEGRNLFEKNQGHTILLQRGLKTPDFNLMKQLHFEASWFQALSILFIENYKDAPKHLGYN